jgi:DNA-binding response OmpR family regulator
MRVLIIEDEIRLAANIAAALRQGTGLAVDSAHDGREGAALAEFEHYDLLLLDLMLPGLNRKKERRSGSHQPALDRARRVVEKQLRVG